MIFSNDKWEIIYKSNNKIKMLFNIKRTLSSALLLANHMPYEYNMNLI